ncbi:MAG: PorP/SprF family type IX secretion system membrane protein [Bacteroidota bacterium]
MRKAAVILMFVLAICSQNASGQDYLLSQRFQLVHKINPAKVGAISSDYRTGMAYRNQWATISNSFVTSVAHYDMPLFKKRSGGSYIGVGAIVLNDRAGKSRLGTFEAHGSIAAHLAANDYNRISTGLQVGYAQRSIRTAGLAWDSQFNGVGYDPSLDHGEDLQQQSRGYLDLALGIEWAHKKKLNYTLSYAVFHYGQNQTFIAGRDRKYLRHVFQGDFEFKRKKIIWNAELIAQVQSGALENQIGVRAKYRIGLDSRFTDNMTSSAVMAGIYFRYGDAITPMIGYEFKRFLTAWFSYDINVSRLRVASRYNGAWEIHLIHTGFFSKRRVKLR